VVDDTVDETRVASRICWRARVLERQEPVSRETRRRRPRRHRLLVEPPSTDTRPLTPVERSRLHGRYAHLTGRSVAMGYSSLGIVVDTATPDEMVATTDALIVEATLAQPEN